MDLANGFGADRVHSKRPTNSLRRIGGGVLGGLRNADWHPRCRTMGGKLGTILARVGHEVVFSNSRNERKLKRLAREAQGPARAGAPRDAVENADALLLAVHWSQVDDVLKQAGDLSGKVVVTCLLPMNADDTALAVGHTSSGAEVLAKKVPKADVVCAFGTVPSEVLFDVFDAKRRTRRRPSLMYCGDDQEAKDLAARLIRDVGFGPVDLARCQSRDTWSPSPSRWHNSRTRGTKDPRSRTASSVSEGRGRQGEV
jgi:predicted dinucleotide-binding enzyme